MCEVALSKCHEKSYSLNLREVSSQSLDLLVMKKVHILLANLREIINSLDLHRFCLNPFSILHIASVCGNLTKIDLRIEVCCKRISMVAAVAIKNIDSIYLIKIVFLSICSKHACNTRIKACSEKRGKSCFLESVFISPLPAVIKICGKALLLAALLIDLAPLRIVSIFRLIVCCIDIIYLTLKAGIHDSKILIWKCNVKYSIRLI